MTHIYLFIFSKLPHNDLLDKHNSGVLGALLKVTYKETEDIWVLVHDPNPLTHSQNMNWTITSAFQVKYLPCVFLSF